MAWADYGKNRPFLTFVGALVVATSSSRGDALKSNTRSNLLPIYSQCEPHQD